MPSSKISIVTPTYNRVDELTALIHSISVQNFDLSNVEHIISDDGSTDGTKELVEEEARKLPYPLIYISQQNQGPGAARNHGIEEASGELILFIDSDCEAHPEWIATIWKAYTKDDFDACGGPDGAKDDFTSLQKAIDYSMTSFLTTGGMRGHSEKMMAKFYPRTHNMGVTKSMVEKSGGFGDLRHGQDIDFSFRIKENNGRIKFLQDALVYHRRRTTLKQFFKQVFNWGVARINLGKISPKLLEPIHYLPAIATSFVLVIVVGAIMGNFLSKIIFLFGVLSLLLFSIAGGKNKKDSITGLWLIAVTPIQVIGYGLGFIYGFYKRYLKGDKSIAGFRKNYYK